MMAPVVHELTHSTCWALESFRISSSNAFTFGPVVILSLFWQRFHYWGACAGICCGAAADIAWLLLFTSTIGTPLVTDTGVYEIVPGFIFGLVVAVIVTLATKAPGKDVIAIYEKATDKSVDD